MTQLLDIYTEIMQAAGLTVKPDGSVYRNDDRYFIKGKPLMLPKSELLSRADANDKIFFHPLAEAAAKGESDILEDLRGRFAFQLNLSTSKLIAFFLALVTGSTKVTLDPEQIKVMQMVKNIGEKEVRDILHVVQATMKGAGKQTPLIKLYLSRRATEINKVKYHRSCVVVFPLYQAAKEELNTKTKGYTLLGVSVNKKALESLCHLFEFIYPGLEVEGAYNQGSTSELAPFADALFRGVGGLMNIFNEQVDMYKSISEVGELRFPTEWLDVVETMDSLFNEINMIPLQPNADGKARVSEVQTSELSQRPKAFHAEAAAPGQMTITNAPVHVAHQTHAPVAAAPQNNERYIRTATGIRLNPNYMEQSLVGRSTLGQAPSAFDPYANQVMMPSATVAAPPPQQHYGPAGYGSYQVPAPSPYVNPGMGTGGMAGRLPGLSY